MNHLALPSLASGLAVTCAAAMVLTPPAPAPVVQSDPVGLTSVALLLDPGLLDSALVSTTLLEPGVADAALAAVPEAAWTTGNALFDAIINVEILVNDVVGAITSVVSWVPLVGGLAADLIWAPVNLIESLVNDLLFGGVYYPYVAAADTAAAAADASAAAVFNLDALPDVGSLLDGGALADVVPDLGGMLLSLLP